MQGGGYRARGLGFGLGFKGSLAHFCTGCCGYYGSLRVSAGFVATGFL